MHLNRNSLPPSLHSAKALLGIEGAPVDSGGWHEANDGRIRTAPPGIHDSDDSYGAKVDVTGAAGRQSTGDVRQQHRVDDEPDQTFGGSLGGC